MGEGKGQNICIISFDQKNKSASQHSLSCFATSLFLLVLHLPELGHMAIPSCKDDRERRKQNYHDQSTPIMSHCLGLAQCYHIKLRRRREVYIRQHYLNSDIRFGHCRIRSWTHSIGDRAFQGEVTGVHRNMWRIKKSYFAAVQGNCTFSNLSYRNKITDCN